MAIITLTSDFGHRDAYVAIVKATLLKLNPNLTLVDISHEIEAGNLAQGAFVLSSAYANFPENTVHLIAVDSLGAADNKIIAAEIEGQFFIGADNGLLSLISEWEPEKIVTLATGRQTTFPAKDIMAPAAAELAGGAILEDMGEETEMKKFLKRSVKATKQEIVGHVIHIDHYGNLITNIQQRDFAVLSQGKKYTIGIGREHLYQIHASPAEVEAGDCFVLFNHMGLLEIGIKNGHAGQLLGMEFDSSIWIKFSE